MRVVTIFRAATWIAAAALGGLLVGYSGILPWTDAPKLSVSSGEARVGGPFRLVSHKGEPVDNAALAGKPYLVFFGFTNCPDICPTTLYELTDLMTELGPTADEFTPVFITVDPERDTQQTLAAYMTAFDPRSVALRGNKAETDAAAKAVAAYYRKVPTDAGNYTMDHTAGVLLMDAAGRFTGTLDMEEPRATRLTKLKNLTDS